MNPIIYVADTTGKIIFISEEIYEFSGYKSDEITGHTILAFVHPEDWDGLIDKFTRTASGELNTSHEFRIISKDGTIKIVQSKSTYNNKELSGILTPLDF